MRAGPLRTVLSVSLLSACSCVYPSYLSARVVSSVRRSAHQDFSPVPKLPSNDYLRFAGTVHALHAIGT